MNGVRRSVLDGRGREARAPAVRAAIFGASLAASLALHGWLWTVLPSLTVGKIPLRPVTREEPVRMRMDKVETETDGTRDWVQPTRFRPEDPEEFARVEGKQDELLSEWLEGGEAGEGTWEAAEPMWAGAAPDGEDGVDDTEAAAEAFRQEMAAVEERLAEAELAELPRRVVPAVERVQGAPDVTLSADAGAIAAAAAAAAQWGEGGGKGGAGTGSGNGGGDAGIGSVAAELGADESALAEVMEAAGGGEEEALADRGRILDEMPEDVSDAEAVERQLTIRTETWGGAGDGWLYFEVQIARAGAESLPVLPKDVLLVQDCSESITRTKLGFFREGLQEYLKTITSVDRINVMKYNDQVETCFEDWEPATAESLTKAYRYVSGFTARGETDLFAPLQHIAKMKRDPKRPMIVLLLTDGRPTTGLLDSSEIISRFTRLNGGNVSMFTLGAGDRVNRFLLDMLGQNNRGGTWYREERAAIPVAMRQASRELSRPVLMNLRYRVSTDAEAEIYPPALTHLYLDRPLRLTGRVKDTGEDAVLQVVGESGGKVFDMVFELDLQGAEDGGEGIRREWVAQKMYVLMNEYMADKNPATMAEIERLSETYNVPLP